MLRDATIHNNPVFAIQIYVPAPMNAQMTVRCLDDLDMYNRSVKMA